MSDAPRRARGEDHPRAKLSDEEVREMRDAYELRGVTMRRIAELWGTSLHTVRHLLRYERRPFTRYKRIPPRD
jgi:DNA invertase Pin-like site-specific DNA recombinase